MPRPLNRGSRVKECRLQELLLQGLTPFGSDCAAPSAVSRSQRHHQTMALSQSGQRDSMNAVARADELDMDTSSEASSCTISRPQQKERLSSPNGSLEIDERGYRWRTSSGRQCKLWR
jgi:hypothetical protein